MRPDRSSRCLASDFLSASVNNDTSPNKYKRACVRACACVSFALERRRETEGGKKRVEKSGCGRLADIKNVKRDPRHVSWRERERDGWMDRETENDAYLQLSNETN